MLEINTYTENRGEITYVVSSHKDVIAVANEVLNSEVTNELIIQENLIKAYING